MKKLLMILFATIISFQMPGCKTNEKTTAGGQQAAGNIVIGDNSQNSLDWQGSYTGVLPCADCEGLLTSITLNKDMTFKRVTIYKGKDSRPYEESGKFNWEKTGSIILLQGITNAPSYYLVGENQLIQLDMEGNRITGSLAGKYILHKNSRPGDVISIVGKKWQLVELNGKPVEKTSGGGRDFFITLREEESRISGYAGCNSFFGNFELKQGNRITFSKIGSTMMACPNMATEQELFKVLESVDNYTSDGRSLQLNKARMAPLARFEMMSE